jgi:cytochrome b6-f complex iron-sulfur subunit
MSADPPQHLGIQPTVSRRELLTYAWLAALAALTAGGALAGLRFATPRAQPGQLGGVVELGPLGGLPPAGSPPLRHPDGRFWLIHSEEGLLALGSTCTHLACQCDWSTLSSQFICPCHGSRFAADGALLEGPAPRGLDRFVVRLSAGEGRLLAETGPAGEPVPAPAGEVDTVVVAVDTGRKIAGVSGASATE